MASRSMLGSTGRLFTTRPRCAKQEGRIRSGAMSKRVDAKGSSLDDMADIHGAVVRIESEERGVSGVLWSRDPNFTGSRRSWFTVWRSTKT